MPSPGGTFSDSSVFALGGAQLPCVKMRLLAMLGLMGWAATALALAVVPWKVKCPTQCVCQIRPWYTPRSVYREANTVDCNDLFISSIPVDLPWGTQTLLLQSNNIARVEQSELDYLANLTELDLSQNSFSDLRDFELTTLPQLLSLHLEENQLAHLPDHSFASLGNLQELYLNHNQLGRISPKAFAGLGNLLRLHLNSNLLRTVDSRWFQGLPNLEVLMIGGNKVDAILDLNFRPLSNLKSLVLAGMSLRGISDYALEGLRSLESLSFYDNQLANVPKRALQQVPGLKFLDLNKNPLQRIRESDFVNMLHLKELGLNNMDELVSLDRFALTNLPELTKLEVTSNPKLSFIHPGAFHHLPQLETLMLNNNALSALHKQTVESLPSLQEISLHGNPIRCDCIIRWINTTENRIRFIEPQSTLCTEPPALKTKHIKEVPFRDMAERCLPLISSTSFSSQMMATSGETISLHCRALAEPDPEIYWVIPSGTKLQAGSGEGRCRVHPEGTLEIRDVTIREAGLYTCLAHNLLGTDSKSVHISVNSWAPEGGERVHLRIGEVETHHILLTWKPYVNAMSSSLTWSMLSAHADIETARLPAGLYAHNITRLQAGTNYQACLHMAFLGAPTQVACVSARTRELGGKMGTLEVKPWVLATLALSTLLVSVSLCGRCHLSSPKRWQATTKDPVPSYVPWSPATSIRVIYPPFVQLWEPDRKAGKMVTEEGAETLLNL
ncbi:leucine-rich repeat neuronal protein 2 [Ambystoma mexicanum]|uniref:leucine-rich repeat neuronal protein 2 n=1 Tax=Ambystoma mexicanum TaxID=8296 RepID=UPI0037E7D47F